MRKFRYLLDPLFLFCVVLYMVNREMIKPYCDFWFFHWYLNDVICIPFTLPPMLTILHLFHIRNDDGPPNIMEISIPLLMIAFAFEVWLPNTMKYHEVTVSDPFDVVAYTIGAVGAWLFWQYWYRKEKEHQTDIPGND